MNKEKLELKQRREESSRYLVDLRMWQTDVRPGEWQLEHSPPFVRHGLRLAHDVRCGDMKCVSPSKLIRGQSQKQRPDFVYDYLICKDDAVLLAICLEDREPGFDSSMLLPGLTVLVSSEEAFFEGQIDPVLDRLDKVVRQELERGANWQCPLRPCSRRLLELMRREWLVEDYPREGLLPTDYGVLLGAIQVSWAGSSQIMCTPRTARRLWERFTPREQPSPSPHPDKLPLAERLQVSRKGLFCHEQEASGLVQTLRDIPLKEYMMGFTEKLEGLQNGLPSRCCRTYGTAAQAISQLLKSPDEDRQDTAIELMLKLVSPLLEDDKILRMGGRGINIAERAPIYPPERYQKLWGRRELDLHALPSQRSPQTFQSRMHTLSMSGFFQGVELLSKSSYPRWLAQSLTYQLGLKDRERYIDLLWLGVDRIRNDDQDHGLKLIYLLAIEPFCMLRPDNDNDQRHEERMEKNNEL